MNPKLIVSYNYKHIIQPDIISLMDGRLINLHISYLPWNKGSDPNFWSFIENTPKCVTIHKIDAHLDTGEILYQRELFFDESTETFRTTYDKLNSEIVSLFMDNWECIRDNFVSPVIQSNKGTYHRKSDFHTFVQHSPMNLDETIKSYKDKYNL